MKANEVHKMNDEELALERDRLRRELYKLRAQAVTEKLENPRQLGLLRKDIARVQTEQRTRELRKNPNQFRKSRKTRRQREQEKQSTLEQQKA
jgi:large subunit ribosomal protein L29